MSSANASSLGETTRQINKVVTNHQDKGVEGEEEGKEEKEGEGEEGEEKEDDDSDWEWTCTPSYLFMDGVILLSHSIVLP